MQMWKMVVILPFDALAKLELCNLASSSQSRRAVFDPPLRGHPSLLYCVVQVWEWPYSSWKYNPRVRVWAQKADHQMYLAEPAVMVLLLLLLLLLLEDWYLLMHQL